MASELHVFDRLMEIAVLIQADLVRSFAGTGLTTSRTHLLWELHRMGPSTQQALADMVRDRELIASQLVADFGEDQLMQFGRSLDTVTGRLRDLVESSLSPTPVTA